MQLHLVGYNLLTLPHFHFIGNYDCTVYGLIRLNAMRQMDCMHKSNVMAVFFLVFDFICKHSINIRFIIAQHAASVRLIYSIYSVKVNYIYISYQHSVVARREQKNALTFKPSTCKYRYLSTPPNQWHVGGSLDFSFFLLCAPNIPGKILTKPPIPIARQAKPKYCI